MNTLKRTQKIPVSIETAWAFFSNPKNLKEITPPYMGFDITSELENEEIYEGLIISYIVKPLFNIPFNWLTEISHVRAPYYFVDNQLHGPYKYWHHQHFFREISGGVEIKDMVNYSAPLGWLGKWAEKTLIDRKVIQIFDYRHEKLKQIFG